MEVSLHTTHSHCRLSSLQLPAASPAVVRDLVAPIIEEFAVADCRLLLAGSLARVDPDADVSLLEGDILLIEDGNKPQDPRGGNNQHLLLLQWLFEFTSLSGGWGGCELYELSCFHYENPYVSFYFFNPR